MTREEALEAVKEVAGMSLPWDDRHYEGLQMAIAALSEPLSDAYMKAVWTWLINYQIRVAELKGSYAPYEVLSWVANDWRKEHGLNQQTSGD